MKLNKFHAAMKLKDTCFLKKKRYDPTRQHIKKQRHGLGDEGPSSQSYSFCNSHV